MCCTESNDLVLVSDPIALSKSKNIFSKLSVLSICDDVNTYGKIPQVDVIS